MNRYSVCLLSFSRTGAQTELVATLWVLTAPPSANGHGDAAEDEPPAAPELVMALPLELSAAEEELEVELLQAVTPCLRDDPRHALDP